MLPAPAGIDESCTGLETRGQSDLNFVILSCAKLLLTMKPAQNVQQRDLLRKKGERGCAAPSPAESASGSRAGLSMVQGSTSNIHIESRMCCALQMVQKQTSSIFNTPLLERHPKS